MAAADVTEATPARIFDRNYRLPVIEIVAVVTIVAIEGMAVTTVTPTVVRALHGLRYYSWGFSAHFLAVIVGMVGLGAAGRALLGGYVPRNRCLLRIARIVGRA